MQRTERIVESYTAQLHTIPPALSPPPVPLEHRGRRWVKRRPDPGRLAPRPRSCRRCSEQMSHAARTHAHHLAAQHPRRLRTMARRLRTLPGPRSRPATRDTISAPIAAARRNQQHGHSNRHSQSAPCLIWLRGPDMIRFGKVWALDEQSSPSTYTYFLLACILYSLRLFSWAPCSSVSPLYLDCRVYRFAFCIIAVITPPSSPARQQQQQHRQQQRRLSIASLVRTLRCAATPSPTDFALRRCPFVRPSPAPIIANYRNPSNQQPPPQGPEAALLSEVAFRGPPRSGSSSFGPSSSSSSSSFSF